MAGRWRQTLSDRRDIETLLFANDAFYQAIVSRDMDALEGLWSVNAPASCVHPGWPPLHGRMEVMESWQRIMAGPAPPQIICHQAGANLIGDIGLVTCYEQIGREWLVATNLFNREGTGWVIFHHQSGPTVAPPQGDDVAEARPLN
ncbi:MAG: nuclear transport factor 2 family protein [Parvibaculum sp.]